MDPISAAASVIGVATLASQVSRKVFQVCKDFKDTEKDIVDVANNASILSTTLSTLGNVLRNNPQVYRPEMTQSVHDLSKRCELILRDIEVLVGIVERGKVPMQTLLSRMKWAWKKDQVKPLQTSLESLKSTLSILLHVIELAKSMTQATVEDSDQTVSIKNDNIEKGKHLLMSLLVNNFRLVRALERLEADNAVEQANAFRPNYLKDLLSLHDLLNPTESSETHKEAESVLAGAQQTSQSDVNEASVNGINSSSKTHPHDENRTAAQDRSSKDKLALARKLLTGCLQYNPSTSQMIFKVIPHRQRKYQTIVQERSDEERAGDTLDFLLEDYTFTRSVNAAASTQPPTQADDPTSIQDQENGDVEHSQANGIHEYPWTRPEVPQSQHSHNNSFNSYSDANGATFPYNMYERPIQRAQQIAHRNHQPGRVDSSLLTDKQYVIEYGDEEIQQPNSQSQVRFDSPPASTRVRTISTSRSRSRSIPRGRSPGIKARVRERSPRRSSPVREPSPEENHPNRFNSNDNFRDMVMYAFDAFITAKKDKEIDHHRERYLKLKEEQNFERMKEDVRREVLQNVRERRERQAEEQDAIEKARPVTLKDSFGRSFVLPLDSCGTWQAMQTIITTTFASTPHLSTEIEKGNYDLIGPSGDIILPLVWEKLVKPGWVVELRIRPQNALLGAAVKAGSPGLGRWDDGDGGVSRAGSAAGSADGKRQRSLRAWLGGRRSRGSVVVGGGEGGG